MLRRTDRFSAPPSIARWHSWRDLGVLALVALAVVFSPAQADNNGDAPGILLIGANVPRAKGLAVDAALMKGWRLRESGPAYSLFETRAPSSTEGQGNIRLRIRAEYTETLPGVRVSLRAAEIDGFGTAAQTVTEVTERYRDNLDNALTSLRRRWAALAKGQDPMAKLDPPPQATRSHSRHATAAPPPEGGIWRYYAEQFALRQNCEFGDQELILRARDPEGETYDAYCYNQGVIGLRCDADGCRLLADKK